MPPVVLVTGAGAGDNITLPSDGKSTSIAFVAVGSAEREVEVAFVFVGGGDAVDQRAEVDEPRGGLGTFESVADILLLLVHGLDLGFEGVLLLVESAQALGGEVVGMEVGGESPVILLVGIVDEGVGMGRLGMEEFDKPWG